MATKRRSQAEIEELPKPQEDLTEQTLTEEEAAGVQGGAGKDGTYYLANMGVMTTTKDGPTKPPETTPQGH